MTTPFPHSVSHNRYQRQKNARYSILVSDSIDKTAKLCCDKCRRQNDSRKGNKRRDPWNNFLLCLHRSGTKNKIVHRRARLFPLRHLTTRATLMVSSIARRSISIISSSCYADLLFVISRISNEILIRRNSHFVLGTRSRQPAAIAEWFNVKNTSCPT